MRSDALRFGAQTWTDAVTASKGPVVVLNGSGKVIYNGDFDRDTLRSVIKQLQ
jgi:hypothetical protein